MFKILTRENITLFLAIIGSVGTVSGWFYHWIVNRKHLKISATFVQLSKPSAKNPELTISISFENLSRLPIAITSVCLCIDGKNIEAAEYPECVGEFIQKENNVVVDRKYDYNLKLPVDVQPLSALSGKIVFGISPSERQNLSTLGTLLIRSTRGREQQIEFLLDHKP